MIVRQEIFDTYWKFAVKRQEIFINRLRGVAEPWTDDPILLKYKFCNVYRASDRVSQFLIKNVIYKGNQENADVVFRILLFKLFNKIETWEYLQQVLGEVSLITFDVNKYAAVLQKKLDAGAKIYSNAYILCANKAFGYDRKHMNHLALIHKMCVEDNIAKRLVETKSLEEVFDLLKTYPLIGDFMAYQLAIDLNYSTVINFSENDFTVAGPGAQRGIRKCFIDTGGMNDAAVIQWMQEHQHEEFKRLGLKFQSLGGRELQLIDCQNLFCEVDKYCRVQFPEVTSSRTRIKNTFSPNNSTIDYFYPPKWGINGKLD